MGASNTQTFSDILRQGISVHANELRGAKAVVDGNFVSTSLSAIHSNFVVVSLIHVRRGRITIETIRNHFL